MRPSAAPNGASEDLRISEGKAADEPLTPGGHGSNSVQVARKMGAGFEAADLGVRGRGPRVARIPESGALNSLKLFSAAELLSGPGACHETGACRGTYIAITAMGIIAVGNRGNHQLALAWDNSLVTPLRSLGRPENVGTRSSALGFW